MDVPYTSDTGPYFNQPVHPEFPAEVGLDADPPLDDVETKTFQPLKWRWESDMTSSNKRIRELGRNCAWYTNWDMPQICGYNEIIKITGDTENYVWQTMKDLPGRRKGLPQVHRVTSQVAGTRVYSKEAQ